MDEKKTKKTYVKPETKVIKLDIDQPILTGSNFKHGGYWG